ncbi:MAG TPA: 2-oxo acid dehydrogenase subunit E2 [Clostridiales bacterium]|nr:2-oxo acid dehydrogenase subunit E2 [Clostridiales bacterium]
MGNMEKLYQKRRRDRYDGWRVKPADPVMDLVPYVLRTRIDSQVLFEEEISIEKLEDFIKQHAQEIPGLSIMYILIAAMVRLISQRPYLNRFIVHNKLYAHNTIKVSVAIKRGLSDKGGEALIKPEFEPDDTLAEIARKIEEEIVATKPTDAENDTDKTAKILGKIPSWIKRPFVNLMYRLDSHGMMPKAIAEASPWHTSAFLTNIGSLGIDSVYHHLYEFGTCSLFLAMGKKNRETVRNEDGTERKEKTMRLRMVTDERICDGHYYAVSMRYYKKILLKPEQLLNPPHEVLYDDEIESPRVKQ